MRRLELQLAAALALTGASIATAHAHASLEQGESAPGSYKAVLRIPHGCDGAPTDTVVMTIPAGYVDVKPMLKPGWTVTTRKGDYAKPYQVHGKDVTSGVLEVTWSGGSLPDDFFDEFIVSGTLAGEEGEVLRFPTVQKCGVAEVAWNEVPAEGQNAHSLEHPAPALTITAAGAGGHDHHAADMVMAGDLEITGGWARAMLPGQPAGGAYLTVTNKGAAPDRLVAAASPNAGKVEIHEMKIENDVMVMRPVDGGLEIPAGGTVELKPGGFHLMFTAVTTPFKEGDSVPVTLQFEKAGKVELKLPVQAKGGDDHAGHGG